MSIDYRSLLLNTGVPSPCHYRPFVCGAGGFPEHHNVIVVGQDPSTRLDTNWWDYWDSETGFDYDRFIAEYVKTRKNQGNSTSKSSARLRLDRIRLNDIKAVETNASKGDDVPDSNRNVVKFLIEKMHDLKAIIAHGAIAHRLIDHLQSEKETQIPDECIFRIDPLRSTSFDEVDNICEQIKSQGTPDE